MKKIIVTQGGTTLAPGETYCVGSIADLLPLLSETLVPRHRIVEADEVFDACSAVFNERSADKITILELGTGTPAEGLAFLKGRDEIHDFETTFCLPKSWYEPIDETGRVYGVAGDFAALLQEVHGGALKLMGLYQFNTELPSATPRRPTPTIDAAILAAYEASPEYDGGEAIDGFQVTPGGKLSWSQWSESGPDIAANFERRVIAGLRSACPKNPPAEWVETVAIALRQDRMPTGHILRPLDEMAPHV